MKKLGFWTATHKEVVAVEQKVLKKFSSFAISSTYRFKGYTECFEAALPIEKVMSFIEKSGFKRVVEKSGLKRVVEKF